LEVPCILFIIISLQNYQVYQYWKSNIQESNSLNGIEHQYVNNIIWYNVF
jgi:hypothetical protein